MKFYETQFEEYISENNKSNLHPKLKKIYDNFPPKINNLKNIIFYGPSGVGKYTQMLSSIKKYSPSELKYEKKISVTLNKQSYFFKISDIHYEINMSLLGCNSKILWHEIFQQIIDIISGKTEKCGIIVCKYFHEIHNELLDNFYSYMQQNNFASVNIKFILITEHLSFIPDNILNCCETIHVSRPTKVMYYKCLNLKIPTKAKLEHVTNIKLLNNYNQELMIPYKMICNKIIKHMLSYKDIHFLKFREMIYDIFIYNLYISDCIWYILSTLIERKYIQSENISDLLIKTYRFFQYYNNNYRPIYHLENYLFYIIQTMHKL